MRRAIIALFAVAGLAALAAAPAGAEAATKKKTVVAKKPAAKAVKPVARSRAATGRGSHRVASLDDAKDLSVQSASALVLDQASGSVLY